ncbi:MAG TPA: YqjK-like family protein [Methylotenera sp.]|nr:YqjK-like family protein [Methylotenera sp.]
MNKKLKALADRRERLLRDSDLQREQLAGAVNGLRAPLALVDQGVALVGFFKKHPVLLASSSALMFKVLRPSRLGKWLSRGLFAWQMVRKLHSKFLA